MLPRVTNSCSTCFFPPVSTLWYYHLISSLSVFMGIIIIFVFFYTKAVRIMNQVKLEFLPPLWHLGRILKLEKLNQRCKCFLDFLASWERMRSDWTTERGRARTENKKEVKENQHKILKASSHSPGDQKTLKWSALDPKPP